MDTQGGELRSEPDRRCMVRMSWLLANIPNLSQQGWCRSRGHNVYNLRHLHVRISQYRSTDDGSEYYLESHHESHGLRDIGGLDSKVRQTEEKHR